MKFYRKKGKRSPQGKLIKEIDSLLFQILKLERGEICEIHNKQCSNIAPMHILSKQSHPRLRFHQQNILLAGWFCSHFWTHHDPDDGRSIFAKQRIKELRGENYKEELYKANIIAPRLTMGYLGLLKGIFELELSELQKKEIT